MKMDETSTAAYLCVALEAALASTYPGLVVSVLGSGALVEGCIELRQDSVIFENFLISITVDHDYPETQPVCREVGGRIPKNAEHHTNSDGTLCLGVPEELWLQMDGTFEIKRFIDSCLIPFLIGVSCKLNGEPWPFGERAHGARGTAEFYGEHFGTDDPSRVLDMIELLSAPIVRGHWPCPCGSGAVLRRCHRKALLDLRERGLPISLLRSSAVQVARLVQERTGTQVAEFRKLAMTMKRIDKNLDRLEAA
jgi:hypothetical protein